MSRRAGESESRGFEESGNRGVGEPGKKISDSSTLRLSDSSIPDFPYGIQSKIQNRKSKIDMSLLSQDDARALLEKVLRYSRADACEARLSGSNGGNLRYARNTVTTAGVQSTMTLVVQASFGKKSGTASIDEFDEASLEKVVRRAEELARLAPENPEFMPPLGPQKYADTPTYVEATANITPVYRAEVAGGSITQARTWNVSAAGFFQDDTRFAAMMNSNGLFAYNRSTGLDFSVTMRTPEGTGSGYVTRDYHDVARFDAWASSKTALDKAVMSRNPRAIEPDKYTVVLEPAAALGLVEHLLANMDARQADEGRSFLSKAGGGTKRGQKIVDERVTIYSDPANSDVPAPGWHEDGRPARRTVWIENGVVKNLAYSRYWAARKGVDAVPGPSNGIMKGGSASLDDLIAGTRRGILVTRFWYIRLVDLQTLLYTGLTRDGTFFIEDGQIRYPIKNFRFNESPLLMLNNLEALGQPMRTGGHLIPSMRIRDFTFTSLSDAV